MISLTSRALLASLLITSACSNEPTQNNTKNLGNETTFTEWCQDWSLSCENITEGDFPIEGSPYSVAQWNSMIDIIGAAMGSPSAFKIDREDILDPDVLTNLREFAEQFNATELFESFIEKIQDGVFLSIQKPLTGNYIEFVPGVQTYESEALGLTLAMNPSVSSVKISITSDKSIRVQGLDLVSSNGQRSSIDTITIDEQNKFNWQGSNLQVSSIPMGALPELIGIDFAVGEDLGNSTSGGILGIVKPMFNILPYLDAKLDLGTNFWNTFRSGQHVLNLPGFEGAVRSTALTFLNKTNSIKSLHNGDGSLRGVGFNFKDNITCGTSNEPMELRIKRNFTIDNYQIRADGVNLDVSQIEVAIIFSPNVRNILLKDQSMVITAVGISREFPLSGSQVNCR